MDEVVGLKRCGLDVSKGLRKLIAIEHGKHTGKNVRTPDEFDEGDVLK